MLALEQARKVKASNLNHRESHLAVRIAKNRNTPLAL